MKTKFTRGRPHISIRRGVMLMAVVLSLVIQVAAREGAPPISSLQQVQPLAAVAQLAMAPVNIAAELQRDSQVKGRGPLRYAVVSPTEILPAQQGTWENLANGGRLWRLRLTASSATDLNFGFTTFWLPPGATLHIASETENYVQGPYTSADNKPHGQLWTPVVPGASAWIEMYVPPGTVDQPRVVLAQVGSGYRDLFHRAKDLEIPKSGACEIDVKCPQGVPWTNEIRSVARYSINGSGLCTGTLVGNTSGDRKNYFLTANHCGLDSINAITVVAYWNYESPTCGQHGGGSLAQNQSGAIFRASRADVDMALVELDDVPSAAFNVYYAGWDRSGAVPTGSVGIHHPTGSEKSISFSSNALTTVNNCINTGGGSVNTHWQVAWSVGVTEPGSSGSGLWDMNARKVVGFLSGGPSFCGGNNLTDCYGKLAVAWDGTSSTNRLKDWLDPLNTGATSVAGIDPGVPSTSNDQCAGAIALTNGVAFAMSTAAATSTGDPVPVCVASGTNAVWFTYTPTGSGPVLISMCGSGYDTVLQVYMGSCGALVPLAGACNDDNGPACGGTASSLSFAGAAGTTYFIQAGGFVGARGSLQIVAQLVNDQCTGAISLTAGTPYTMSTLDATSTNDAPVGCGSGVAKGVWFRYTPAVNGVVTIDTCGSSFDTVIQAYTGACGALVAAANGCNDDSGVCANNASFVEFVGTAGTVYFIQVGGYAGNSGDLSITVDVRAPMILTVNSTPNLGVFVNADPQDVLSQTGGTTSFTRTYASNTVVNLYASSPNGVNVFSKWQLDGVDITTDQSAFVTMGANHTATAIYLPANDQCFGAVALTNAVPYAMSTTIATDLGDPLSPCAPLGKGVWFTFTPTANQLVTVSSCGSSFDTVIQVFTGTCGALNRVGYGCNDDSGPACAGLQASLVFYGLAGTNYSILAGGFNGNSGNLQIVVTSSLVNDACAAALPLSFGAPFKMDNVGAASIGDPVATCAPLLSNGVWFTFVSPITGPVPVSTCGSSFDTVLQVFTNACGALSPMVCNDDNGPACAGLNASLSINAVAGETYRILVGGFLGARGTLNIMVGTPPVISVARGASDLLLSWPNYYYPSYVLQSQTNTLGIGASSNWVDILPNNNQRYFNPIPATPPSFYRLKTP